MRLVIAKVLPLVPCLLMSAQLHAGAYIFSGEQFGVDVVTHPNTYTGSEDVVTVRVCIDPNSPNAIDMEYSVQNNIDAYNQLIPTTANVKQGASNNIPSNAIDFESVALHEIGHCLGMAHINAASESGLTGNDANYTKATDGDNNVLDIDAGADGVIGSSDDVRGDDQNLVWFRKSNNDPFTIDTVIDSTTYSRDLADLPTGHTFAANADRAVSTHLGYTKTEAVMQQETFFNEAQRTLGHDDVATLRYAASGIDERESGGPGNRNARDNYTIVLQYGGISTTNCDVSMGITSTVGLAFCSVDGQGIGGNHVRIDNPYIEFGDRFNWFFNAPNTPPVLNNIDDVSLLDGGSVAINIVASDVDENILTIDASGLPAFASFIDNGDGTATINVNSSLGENSITPVSITVTDNGDPALFANQVFNIEVLLDTDKDGLSDIDEVNVYSTLPTEADTDADGLDDYQEIFVYFTSALDADSDNDLLSDGIEVNNGTDPNDILDWPVLADGDLAPLGQPDGLINAADYLLLQRIVLGDLGTTNLELSHGDLYPPGSPDGLINVQDMILLLKLIQ